MKICKVNVVFWTSYFIFIIWGINLVWNINTNTPQEPEIWLSDIKITTTPELLEKIPAKWKVTAYCPCEKCCGKWADNITANGHIIKKGDKFVAAPKRFPFGTKIIIPGYNNGKPVPVLDRGGAIKGNKIDVYFDTHQEALNWGVKYFNDLVVVK